MYINDNNRICDANGIHMIINTENGAVVGVDDNGLEQYKKLLERDDVSFTDKRLYDFLQENEFISYRPFDKTILNIKSAYLHVTNKCNLHCLGCYSNNYNRNKSSDLSSDEIIKILDELSSVNVENLVISGGEPLLREDIEKLMWHAKQNSKIDDITLITNGTVGDRHLYSNLAMCLDTIAVSLDTYSSICKAFLRDEGIFDTIVSNIKQMQEVGLNVSIIVTLNHKNVDQMKKYVELADELGVGISFSIFTTRTEQIYKEFILQTEDLKLISNNLMRCNVEEMPINNTLEGKRHCGTGCNILSISADGDVYPCHMLMETEFKMGNLLHNSMREILITNNLHKRCWENDVEDIEGCTDCEYKYLCGGGCRARAYIMGVNIESRDPFCSMFKMYYDKMFSNIRKSMS